MLKIVIEVMIVLVIAAIILLIVFLAVPALQRNSRNTQRKNDVANVLAALSEYASNNNGQLPTTAIIFNTGVKPNINAGFYDVTSEVTYSPTGTATAIADNNVSLLVYRGTSCNGNTPTTTGATTRQFAAIYNIENGSGLVQEQCQEG